MLARNVDYEVPFYRKQAAKAQQQLADLERKHAEHLRSAVLAAKQYRTASFLGFSQYSSSPCSAPSGASEEPRAAPHDAP